MKKIEGSWKYDMLCFDHFAVKKESDQFYGVYEYTRGARNVTGDVITSSPTLKAAAKKAKLLEIGYQMCKEHMDWN